MFVCAEACPLCAITQSPPTKSSFKKQMGEEVRARQARGGRVEGSIKKGALLPLWQSGQEDSLFHSSPVPPSLRWESSLLWHCFSSKATFDLHLGDIYLQWTSKAAERQSRTCQGLSLRRDSWNKSVPIAWETRPRPQGILSGMDAARLSCQESDFLPFLSHCMQLPSQKERAMLPASLVLCMVARAWRRSTCAH